MDVLLLVPYYMRWHYTKGIRDFFSVWHRFLFFIANFFSLAILAKTLIAPWRRMHESYGEGLRPGEWAGAVIVNTLMRIVGFVIRLTVLIAGFLSLVFSFIFGLVLFLCWLALPLLLVFLVASGLEGLLS